MDTVKIGFYLSKPNGEVYKLDKEIYTFDEDHEISFLVDEFKTFLSAVGYGDVTTSHVQLLEDDEWRGVLKRYGDWNEHYERVYNDRREYFS